MPSFASLPVVIRLLPALCVTAALAMFAVVGASGPTAVDAGPVLVPPRWPPLAVAGPPPRPLPAARLPHPAARSRVLPHSARLFAEVLTPQEVSLRPSVIASNVAFAALLTGVLFYANRLITPVEHGIRHAARRLTGRDLLGQRRASATTLRTALLFVLLLLLNASLRSFLSSDTGPLSGEGLFVAGSMLLSALLLSGAAEAARLILARRLGVASAFEVRPAGTILAAGSVAGSRLFNLSPGFVLGGGGGIVHDHVSRPGAAGRLALGALAATVTVGAFAWGMAFVAPWLRPDGWAASHAQDAALALFLSAVQGLVFGLIPAGSTPGSALWSWQRRVWLAFALPTTFLLFHTMLNPAGTFLDAARSDNAPVVILLAGLLCAVPALPAVGTTT